MDRDIYEIKTPANLNRDITVEAVVPGSKSITNRALLIAAMAEGTSTLSGCLTSDDARHFLNCLKVLGFPVSESSDGNLGSDIEITGFGGDIPNKSAEIYVGSAGTAARFLVAMLAFSEGEYTVNSSEQMKKRPMEPLIEALRNAGAEVRCLEEEGHFPLQIKGAKGRCEIPSSFSVNIDKSSQFLSALLIAAGTLGKAVEINAIGSHGSSYVDLTTAMMKGFGVCAEKQVQEGCVKYVFSGADRYMNIEYDVEPDMSAAAYFYALAAILGVSVSVKGVSTHMLQGDTELLKLLERMGCDVTGLDDETDTTIVVTGPEGGVLKGGFEADMSAFSDQALTVAAIAPFADEPITITGIGHIRLQECDRIKAIVNNLAAMGIRADEKPDAVTIYPGTPHGADIETYDDHRVAMSFALTGLRTEGVRILDYKCCSKTFSQYFEVLEKVLNALG